jgi:polycystin 1L2
LGDLTYLKIWHDNSGIGDKTSWFLSYVIVIDLQTNEEFYFFCQNWLALEQGDGKIERELFIACENQKTELKFLMQKQATHYLNDGHLWLSVFKKPIQSSFTRLDRVTCCFVFHFLTMVLNILYYKNTNDILPNDIKIDFGLFKFSMEQVISKRIYKL